MSGPYRATKRTQLWQQAIRVCILYTMIWFIDLLDASILNVALPTIADAFGVEATRAEWAIIGFMLARLLYRARSEFVVLCCAKAPGLNRS